MSNYSFNISSNHFETTAYVRFNIIGCIIPTTPDSHRFPLLSGRAEPVRKMHTVYVICSVSVDADKIKLWLEGYYQWRD